MEHAVTAVSSVEDIDHILVRVGYEYTAIRAPVQESQHVPPRAARGALSGHHSRPAPPHLYKQIHVGGGRYLQ